MAYANEFCVHEIIMWTSFQMNEMGCSSSNQRVACQEQSKCLLFFFSMAVVIGHMSAKLHGKLSHCMLNMFHRFDGGTM